MDVRSPKDPGRSLPAYADASVAPEAYDKRLVSSGVVLSSAAEIY